MQIILSLHIAEGPEAAGGGGGARGQAILQHYSVSNEKWRHCRPKRVAVFFAGKLSVEKYRLQPFWKKKKKRKKFEIICF